MAKINYHEHQPDWVDGLLAITDSARRILLALKRSRIVSEPATNGQKSSMRTLGIYYSKHIASDNAQILIDRRSRSILASIVEQGP